MNKKLSLDKERIINMYNSGFSGTKIAKEIGCHYSTIYDFLNSNQIHIKGTKFFNKGKIGWNKGLTKENDDRLKESGIKCSETKKRQISEGTFIPYWLGKERKQETKDKISETKIKQHRITKSVFKIGHILGKRFKKGEKSWNYGLTKKEDARIKSRKKIFDTNKEKEIIKMYTINPITEIAKYYNTSTTNILNVLRRNNIKIRGAKFFNPLNKKLSILLKERRKNQIIPVKDTSIEIKIQNFLKQLNIDFLTHQYIKDIEHGYQCDILIPSMNLVIECDGDYWHKYPIGNDIDHIRTSELISKGFKVLRLWENEIKVMELNQFKNKLK